jgi:hypothetical protein
MTGKRWVSLLNRKLWDVAWDQWAHRNGILHNTEHTLRMKQVDKQLETGQAQGPKNLPQSDRDFFSKTLEEHPGAHPATEGNAGQSGVWRRKTFHEKLEHSPAGGTHQMIPGRPAIPNSRSSPKRAVDPKTHTHIKYIYYLSESRTRKINIVPPYWKRPRRGLGDTDAS